MSVSKPSLIICTPCFGGLVYYTYTQSLLNTFVWCGNEKILVNAHLMGNESLITRARNTCAALAVNSGFDKLLFIDADISWTDKDIWRLYYSDKKIIGGIYPQKHLPLKMNFNALYPHRVKYFSNMKVTPEEFGIYAREEANEAGEVEVEHLATGFLMIDKSVLLDLIPRVPHYESTHMVGASSGTTQFADLFQCGASADGFYFSEDYFFCDLARKHGHSVWLNTNVILPHTGTHTYRVPDDTANLAKAL